jgi:hypothetical protein
MSRTTATGSAIDELPGLSSMDNRKERRGNNMNDTFTFSPIIIGIALVIASIVFVCVSSIATSWKAGRVFMDERLPIKRLGLSTRDLQLAIAQGIIVGTIAMSSSQNLAKGIAFSVATFIMFILLLSKIRRRQG